MTSKPHLKKIILGSSAAVICLVYSSGLSIAATTKPSSTVSSTAATQPVNITQAVTQSYNATSAVQLGMIVSLEPKSTSTVVPLTQASINQMLGAVVTPNDASVTLTPATATTQQVFVATSGRYPVLVSNQNGPIRAGDYVTISSVGGVGMKADDNEAIILGTAASGFDGTSDVVGTEKLTEASGKTLTVSIGEINIDLDVSHNPLSSKATDYVPGFLAKTAQTVSGKPVSAARIYLGLVTLIISAMVTGNLLYSGVRSGMLAIGRNPLSRKSIIRSLIQTVVAGLIIFIVGVFAVYLLLRL